MDVQDFTLEIHQHCKVQFQVRSNLSSVFTLKLHLILFVSISLTKCLPKTSQCGFSQCLTCEDRMSPSSLVGTELAYSEKYFKSLPYIETLFITYTVWQREGAIEPQKSKFLSYYFYFKDAKIVPDQTSGWHITLTWAKCAYCSQQFTKQSVSGGKSEA